MNLLFVLRPASLTALAFEHADRLTVLGVQHLPGESRLSPALARANWMLGVGTCKLSATEIVHGLTPLSESKLRSEQTFLICLSDLQIGMEQKSRARPVVKPCGIYLARPLRGDRPSRLELEANEATRL